MKQLVQNLKSGEMKLLDVPTPALSPGKILVRVFYSLISAGTEGSKVSTARKGYLGKAKEKPEQVKQVLDTFKKEGFANTYRKVMNKLDAWAPLGYSCAGEVIETGAGLAGFTAGDIVACAGQDIANHAEVVSVPLNLCVKVPQGVAPECAAYNTLGAIALQGVRQADLRLGESCAVIGLGLLGQLTVQMLKASGIMVFGIDVNPLMVDKALQSGADYAFARDNEDLEQAIASATAGQGVDVVIITAGTNSLDPVELAGRLARKKGRVVVVGAVPTGFSREHYYRKELDLRMSCSYGPGRYDPLYEEQGFDYPYGYVRWTEKRNMEAFLQLIGQGKISFDFLTTHTFDFDNAPQAYEMILNKSEPYLGILLRYHRERAIERTVRLNGTHRPADVRIGFIGAGSFAQSYLLPNVKKYNAAALIGVATASGNNARTVAEKFGFSFAAGDEKEIIEHKDVNTVFIATRHNQHAEQTLAALKAGKNVFVEKPLALTMEELEQIREAYQTSIPSQIPNPKSQIPNPKSPILMVGFNRRFAPLVKNIKESFQQSPMSIIYRVNAGSIAADHWAQDKVIGGGRIIGEVCHFLDLALYLTGSLPRSLYAALLPDAENLEDTVSVNVKFKNGSIASIHYFANGSGALEKEYLEVYSRGKTAILKDFKSLEIFSSSKKVYKSRTPDKGHKKEVFEFLKAVKNGEESPISFEEIYYSMWMTFSAVKSIRENKVVNF